MTSDQVDRYLARIGYRGSRDASLETLRALQLAHLLAVPFENLDIVWGTEIVLDDDALFRKIVERSRGGFCYELNGLFARLLRALGFEVTMLSARVADRNDVLGPDFDHMALLVPFDQERWLVDVGFGESSRWPLDLDDREAQQFEVNLGPRYRLVDANGEWTMLSDTGNGQWRRQYVFTLTPRILSDYEAMCRFQETSPDSHFVTRTICSLATTVGRKSLSADRFIVTKRGERHEQEVSKAEWNRTLLGEFGIRAPQTSPASP